jgi:hypothetical protein
VLLIKMYSNFVNFLCSWSSMDTVGIREDGVGIGDRDGEKFGERGRERENCLRTFPVR